MIYVFPVHIYTLYLVKGLDHGEGLCSGSWYMMVTWSQLGSQPLIILTYQQVARIVWQTCVGACQQAVQGNGLRRLT